ncbi:MAG: TrkA family potassium uptake protein [Propionibacteriaceae bacterium]|jgi:trk system potassium uptake protein TrkA|nr:TrkA family potassium uptake protein [Propionibacteriaceae bacterium]
MLYYVIMGCGRVGAMLARALEQRGHDVAAIDINPDAFRRLGPDFKGLTVTGVGFDRDVLIRAGIEQAHGLAAVADGDNTNILVARTAREHFNVPTVVARIYDPARAEVYERLGIPTVATVRWTADQVLRRLIQVGGESIWRDPSGLVRLVELAFHPGWIGWPIRALERQLATPVPLVTRFGQGLVTTDDTVLQDGDILYAMVDSDRASRLIEILNGPPPAGEAEA